MVSIFGLKLRESVCCLVLEVIELISESTEQSSVHAVSATRLRDCQHDVLLACSFWRD